MAELGERLDATELFDQPSRTLSLGRRMRCELAACLLHSPDLLFLDEPSIGLDLVAKQQFRQLLVELNEELGCTIFLTSHDVADIEHVADRAVIVVLYRRRAAWSLWFGGVPVSTTALLLAAPSIMLAIFNNIVGQIGVGAFSFWIRDVRGLWFIYQKLVFLLGGMLLPLEILPSGVESVAKAMPFMTMAYVPGRLASGHVEPVLLVWQLGWSVVLVTASAWLFARGVERIRRQP